MGPLTGLRVIELAGLGPAPFGAMMLSDMGAEVIRVERPDSSRPDANQDVPIDFVKRRGRLSVTVDLRQPGAADVVLRLAEQADAFVEGLRPGVASRLGVGPEACLRRNPALVYAQMTGWGQDGPLAQTAGHDINYLALSGLLHAIGPAGGPPVPPLNLVADHGGGGMLLAFAVVSGMLEASRSGRGQVIDVAMLDGATLVGALFHGLAQTGRWRCERGTNLLDGGAPFYGTYETADGRWVAVGAWEPQFYGALLDVLGFDARELPGQFDEDAWPSVRDRFAARFRQRTRDEWVERAQGRDACLTPVLTFDESLEHPHNVARRRFVALDGVLQAGPAPLFSRTPPEVPQGAPRPGEHTLSVLRGLGFADAELDALLAGGAIKQAS